ncbi:hypothetical protein K469DRAFT_698579 [Zopfia rhizophila CBS 207.26]|uniref:DUF1772-domain-containing protein n=1 Tax=Zopfia rhizophila CBS 207.26 TaxID=1314779 RepID=A0A6A6EVI4_9PEZI|nr:hypothetical protein K469DRAFT_698579 [Zopfia rhizophila CBS 207.26]
MSTATILGVSSTLTPPLLAALRIAPLLGTTATLAHAYMEETTTRSLFTPTPSQSPLVKSIIKPIQPTKEPTSSSIAEKESAQNIAIPVYFTTWFNRGVWGVIGINAISTWSAVGNLLVGGLGESRKWYVAGLVTTISHFLFVPLVVPSVQGLMRMCVEQEKGGKGEEGRAKELVREWNGVHRIRMCTVDLVAWGSFGAGILGYFAGKM